MSAIEEITTTHINLSGLEEKKKEKMAETSTRARRESGDLSALLLPELRKVANSLGIEGAGEMKKPDLVKAISDLQAANREAARAEREARRAERMQKRKGASSKGDSRDESDDENSDDSNDSGDSMESNSQSGSTSESNSEDRGDREWRRDQIGRAHV